MRVLTDPDNLRALGEAPQLIEADFIDPDGFTATDVETGGFDAMEGAYEAFEGGAEATARTSRPCTCHSRPVARRRLLR